MKSQFKKKVTLMLDVDIYHGLQAKVGGRGMGEYLSQLARPYVLRGALASSYQALANETADKPLATAWARLDEPITDENIWRL